MQIHVPENISSGEFPLLPNGVAKALLEKIVVKNTQKGDAQLMFKYIITEEMASPCADGSPTLGVAIVQFFSLSEKAIAAGFLNRVYKQVTGEKLPQGDWATAEEFCTMLSDAICGSEWNLVLEQEPFGDKAELRTYIKTQTLK